MPLSSVVQGHFDGELMARLMSAMCRTGRKTGMDDNSGSNTLEHANVALYPL